MQLHCQNMGDKMYNPVQKCILKLASEALETNQVGILQKNGLFVFLNVCQSCKNQLQLFCLSLQAYSLEENKTTT